MQCFQVLRCSVFRSSCAVFAGPQVQCFQVLRCSVFRPFKYECKKRHYPNKLLKIGHFPIVTHPPLHSTLPSVNLVKTGRKKSGLGWMFQSVCMTIFVQTNMHCTSSLPPHLWFGCTEMRHLTILTALLVRTKETI